MQWSLNAPKRNSILKNNYIKRKSYSNVTWTAGTTPVVTVLYLKIKPMTYKLNPLIKSHLSSHILIQCVSTPTSSTLKISSV